MALDANHNSRNVLFMAGACLAGGFFLYLLGPAAGSGEGESRAFLIKRGDGFVRIADRLKAAHLIRSAPAFKLFTLVTGAFAEFQPGGYSLRSDMTSPEILRIVTQGFHREVAVRIPEGASIYEVDELLHRSGVLPDGAWIRFAASASTTLEGRLFPDTYRFFISDEVENVAEKFLGNFEAKAGPVLARDRKNKERNLILASLLEKEVPELRDRKIVADILLKRLDAGMPLQVDATVCYAKEVQVGRRTPCDPLTLEDLKIVSSYNTYAVRGLPPAPIGSPGVDAIEAALDPIPSPYWFYLSDPRTKKTIFSITFEQHVENRARYLR